MVNFNPIKKIIILSSFFLVIFILLIILLALPLIRDIKNYSRESVNLKITTEHFREEVFETEKFKKNRESLDAGLAKIRSSFAERNAPISLIEFWENTAKECGLSVEISSLSVSSQNKFNWSALGFKLDLRGSFDRVLRFTDKLENGPYLGLIQSFSSSSGKDENVDAELKILVFTK